MMSYTAIAPSVRIITISLSDNIVQPCQKTDHFKFFVFSKGVHNLFVFVNLAVTKAKM